MEIKNNIDQVYSLDDFFEKLKLNQPLKEKLQMVYKFTQIKMKNLKRKSGEPYFNHCVRTATIIIEEFDVKDLDTILLALMHDIKEDTNTHSYTVELIGWKKILKQIHLLSKNDENIKAGNKIERNQKYFERLQQINDEAVLLVKIADRIDNLRTLIWVFPDKKVESKLQETIDYILPLAEKLKKKNSKPYEILLNEIEKIKKYLKNSQTNKELTDLFSKK